MKILFITSTRVGDAILSTGLLDHLIKQYPGASITVACGPAAASLFATVPGLERIIVLDKMAFSLHWLRLWVLCVFRIWDVVVDLRRSPMYYMLAASKRVQLGRGKQGVHRIRQLAHVLGMGDNPPSPHLWMTPALEQRAKDLIPDGTPVLAIGPTANWRAKTWRSEYFSELIERLTGPSGIMPGGRVVIFGRDDERPTVLRLIDSIPPAQRIDLVGHLDLIEAYACLRRCQLFVGNDSGLMHLAAASGTPTLGLFGPTPKEQYAPWGERCRVVSTAVPYEKIFPENFNHVTSDSLMDSLSVDDVERAARLLWDPRTEAA